MIIFVNDESLMFYNLTFISFVLFIQLKVFILLQQTNLSYPLQIWSLNAAPAPSSRLWANQSLCAATWRVGGARRRTPLTWSGWGMGPHFCTLTPTRSRSPQAATAGPSPARSGGKQLELWVSRLYFLFHFQLIEPDCFHPCVTFLEIFNFEQNHIIKKTNKIKIFYCFAKTAWKWWIHFKLCCKAKNSQIPYELNVSTC